MWIFLGILWIYDCQGTLVWGFPEDFTGLCRGAPILASPASVFFSLCVLGLHMYDDIPYSLLRTSKTKV